MPPKCGLVFPPVEVSPSLEKFFLVIFSSSLTFHPLYNTYLKVASVYPEGSLWEVITPYEFEVEGPDPIVLCERKRSEGAVESPSGTRDLTLVHQKLAVVDPDTRHL